MNNWLRNNVKLLKRIALLSVIAIFISLTHVEIGIYDCRGPEFCRSERPEWGWPLPLYEDAALNSGTNFGNLRIWADNRYPASYFVIDYLFYFAILFILAKVGMLFWKKFVITSPNTGYAVRELNKIISFVKNKKIPIVTTSILLLIILSVIFYQYQLMPRIIMRRCAQSAIKLHIGTAAKTPAETRNNFEKCLLDNGVQNNFIF